MHSPSKEHNEDMSYSTPEMSKEAFSVSPASPQAIAWKKGLSVVLLFELLFMLAVVVLVSTVLPHLFNFSA